MGLLGKANNLGNTLVVASLCTALLGCGASRTHETSGALFDGPGAKDATIATEPGPEGDYLQSIYPGIRDGWRTFVNDCVRRLPKTDPLNQTTLAVSLRWSLLKSVDGAGTQIVDMRIMSSSGNKAFDQAAVDVVRGTSFPVPPAASVSDDDRIHFEWTFSRDNRMAGNGRIVRVEWDAEKSVPKLLANRNSEAAIIRISKLSNEEGEKAAGFLKSVALSLAKDGLLQKDPASRQAAASLTGQGKFSDLTGELLIAVRDSNADVRKEAMRALSVIGGSDAEKLFWAIVKGEQDFGPDLPGYAVQGLVRLGKQAEVAAVLREQLAGKQEKLRWSALSALTHETVPGVAGELVKIVDNGPKAEKLAALTALGMSDPSEKTTAQKALLKALAIKDASIRSVAARSFGDAAAKGIKSKSVYWELVKLLKDPDQSVRAAAVFACARIDPARFGAELYLFHKETAVAVELSLAQTLGEVPGKDAAAKLQKLVASTNPDVRKAAVMSYLRRLEADKNNTKNPKGAADAASALASLRNDPDPDIRLAASDSAALSDLANQTDDSPEMVKLRGQARLHVLRTSQGANTSILLAQWLASERDAAERLRLLAAWIATA